MRNITIALITLNAVVMTNVLFAQSQSSWVVQGHSLTLPFYSTSENKYATIAIAYEKKFFSCQPSIALIVADGRSLGSFRNGSKSSSTRNRLKLTINNRDYFADGDTVLNTYANGIEIVSFFDVNVIEALKSPSNISVYVGNNPPRLSGRSTNSINVGLRTIIQSCERN